MTNNNERIDNYIAKNTIIDGSHIVWNARMSGYQPFYDMQIGTKVYRIIIRDYLWTMEKNKGDTLETSCKNPKCVDPAHIVLIGTWENLIKRLMKTNVVFGLVRGYMNTDKLRYMGKICMFIVLHGLPITKVRKSLKIW